MRKTIIATLALVVIALNASGQQRPEAVVVAQGLQVPWSIAFAPDGRIFVTERPGRLRVISNGALQAAPLFTFPRVEAKGEEGLMGLVLHPDFQHNHLLYVSFASTTAGKLTVEVDRFRETGTTLVEPKVILAGAPASQFHAGCRLKFGPDGKLYITTGDATRGPIAQDLKSLGGKILRVNDDGTIPADNPFPGSPVWTYGHRNSQGIAWDPVSGLLFETEHGPSGFDGPGGGDEVNIIERGKNYGWPIVHHKASKEGMVSPLLEYTPACAPASAAFWKGDLYFGCLRGQNLHHVRLDPKDRRKVLGEEKLFATLGRIRDVEVGPDGALYFTTSNRDGRGSPARDDDRVYRIAP